MRTKIGKGITSKNAGTIVLQVDFTVERSKNKGNIFLGGQNCRFNAPHGHFLCTNLHYRSKFQRASNDLKFGIHLVHKILRTMGKR